MAGRKGPPDSSSLILTEFKLWLKIGPYNMEICRYRKHIPKIYFGLKRWLTIIASIYPHYRIIFFLFRRLTVFAKFQVLITILACHSDCSSLECHLLFARKPRLINMRKIIFTHSSKSENQVLTWFLQTIIYNLCFIKLVLY